MESDAPFFCLSSGKNFIKKYQNVCQEMFFLNIYFCEYVWGFNNGDIFWYGRNQGCSK